DHRRHGPRRRRHSRGEGGHRRGDRRGSDSDRGRFHRRGGRGRPDPGAQCRRGRGSRGGPGREATGGHRRPRGAGGPTVIDLLPVLVPLPVLLPLIGTDANGPQVVAIGGWQPPAGIVLVADRLSSLMLIVSSLVTLCVLVYALSQDANDDSNETPISVFNPSYLVLCAGIANSFLA